MPWPKVSTIVAGVPAGASEGEGIAPGGPGGGAPAAGAAVVAGGPAVAGGPVGGPKSSLVAGQFSKALRPHRHCYGGVCEHKMELMLFEGQ